MGEYVNNSDNRVELLNMLLMYKDNGIDSPFNIEEELINTALKTEEFTKH